MATERYLAAEAFVLFDDALLLDGADEQVVDLLQFRRRHGTLAGRHDHRLLLVVLAHVVERRRVALHVLVDPQVHRPAKTDARNEETRSVNPETACHQPR